MVGGWKVLSCNPIFETVSLRLTLPRPPGILLGLLSSFYFHLTLFLFVIPVGINSFLSFFNCFLLLCQSFLKVPQINLINT